MHSAEKKGLILKHENSDVNAKLGSILGKDFVDYRDAFAKSQDYITPDFPLTVYLELMNRCNLNCVMCDKINHKPPHYKLSFKVIKKILDECQQYKMPSVVLGSSSELLMHPEIPQILSMIKDAGVIDVFFRTNGVLLTDEIIDSVIELGVTRVLVSLDAVTPETYKKIRGHDYLEQVENNIERLISRRNDLPTIRVSFVEQPINRHEKERFLAKWRDRVDCVDFQRLVTGKSESDYIENPYCASPFYSLNITANGNINPCCELFHSRNQVLGNIYSDSLKDVWHGKAINDIRQSIKTKCFTTVCSTCLSSR